MLALRSALVCPRPLCWSVRSGCQAWLSTCSPDPKPPLKKQTDEGSLQDFRSKLVGGPSLQHFLQSAAPTQDAHCLPVEIPEDPAPYLEPLTLADSPKKVYLETFGCQMNVSDTETAWAILQRSGYQRTRNLAEADVVLLVTCSIRKGNRPKSRGTKDQLLIDKMILGKLQEKEDVAWIDYKKAFDSLPHDWIIKCLEITGVSGNIRIFVQRSMAQWKTTVADQW